MPITQEFVITTLLGWSIGSGVGILLFIFIDKWYENYKYKKECIESEKHQKENPYIPPNYDTEPSYSLDGKTYRVNMKTYTWDDPNGPFYNFYVRN